MQHLDEEELTRFVAERVANAATGQGLTPEKIAPPHLSPPASRRRAAVHAASLAGRIALGFREGGSHNLVDLAECPVLVPELAAMVAPLRKLLARHAQGDSTGPAKSQGKGKGRHKGPDKSSRRIAADIELAVVEQGVDIAITGLTVEGLGATEAMLDFARDHGLARLTLDQGYGPEALWEPEPVTVSLAGISVGYPPGAFLQATADGEAVLVAAAREWLAGANTVADLFAGLGTFSFALAGPTKVLAVEAARDTHMACKAAAGRNGLPIHAMHRDLFRNPLQTDELDRFDAVLLDPPRAGARDQVALIAQSSVPRVVYISCNPSSWARDAVTLVEGGYRLVELRPVGQFRWSTHVELASLFVRGS
ncbi:MAG TPA: hypothetical protein VLZ53_12740 [Devosia sp.]|nr:hypothetical protein [Devosia sp.]